MSEYDDLKKKYEDLKTKQAQIVAKQEMLLESLKKHGCDSLEDAVARIAELETSITKTEERVKKSIAAIKAALDES